MRGAGYQRRERGGARAYGAVAFGAGVVLAIGWWWFAGMDSGGEQRSSAVVFARGEVADAVGAGRRPVEVAREQSRERAPEGGGEWSKGSRVQLAGELGESQSVFEALRGRGVPAESIEPVVGATGEAFDFRRSRPGDEWRVRVAGDGTVERFRYRASKREIWETVRNADGSYSCRRVEIPVKRREVVLAGEVDGSLWGAMSESGATADVIEAFAGAFAYSVDFNRETRAGDRFAMVVERMSVEGEFLEFGPVLAAVYVNQGVEYRAFRREKDGTVGYYNEDGENMKRQFLKSPIDSVRVTSGFGRRYHPVLGREKMHRGVDYGAPTGTPVRTVADGVVEVAGYDGPSGNLVVVDHAGGYETIYAHLSSIADSVEPGREVQKESVVGRVGSTGRSTGPHLHFGMTHRGEYVDPREVESERAPPLEGDERRTFVSEVVDPLDARLDVAMGESADGRSRVAAHGRRVE